MFERVAADEVPDRQYLPGEQFQELGDHIGREHLVDIVAARVPRRLQQRDPQQNYHRVPLEHCIGNDVADARPLRPTPINDESSPHQQHRQHQRESRLDVDAIKVR